MRFVEIPPESKIALVSFLKADYIPVLYFNNTDRVRASLSNEDKNKRTGDVNSKSISQKLLHQMSHLSGRSSAVNEDLDEEKINPLALQVSRNDSESHLRYDVS